MSGNIFVSYRRDDAKHAAGRLVDRLTAEFGEESIFMDVDSIGLGLDFQKVINEKVSACDVMLVVIGPEWLTMTDAEGRRRLEAPHDFVRLEVEAALQRDIRVVPLLVDGAEPPSPQDLPPSIAKLANRQSTRLDHESFVRDSERLTEAVAQLIGHTPIRAGHVRPVSFTGDNAHPLDDDVNVRALERSDATRMQKLRGWLLVFSPLIYTGFFLVVVQNLNIRESAFEMFGLRGAQVAFGGLWILSVVTWRLARKTRWIMSGFAKITGLLVLLVYAFVVAFYL